MKSECGKVIQGPWPSNLLGRALTPDNRAGRYLPAHACCLIIDSPYYEDRGYWSSCRLRPGDRPVLQLNLPFSDLPTLGKIARKLSPRPWEPRFTSPRNMPLAIHRYLYGWKESDFYWIDPERLLQDPDWYEKLPA